MTKDLFLGNKTALVTGASSGIGAATGVALASVGARVVLHFNSNATGAELIAQQIQKAGGTATLLSADLSTREGTQTLTRYAASNPIDILVNNAGSLLARTPILEMTEDLWERVMMLNFTSAFFLSQAVLPGMKQRQQGVIVNVSSVAARTGGGIGALAYSSAKAAVSVMTKGFSREFAASGIRVNAVSPGTITTNYHKVFSTEDALEAVRCATPAQRIGVPEEVADVIAFLCSDRARFIHGQVIEVNGGFLMA
jgi:3-oxoacyl-[acyl-carrier protein] reductase